MAASRPNADLNHAAAIRTEKKDTYHYLHRCRTGWPRDRSPCAQELVRVRGDVEPTQPATAFTRESKRASSFQLVSEDGSSSEADVRYGGLGLFPLPGAICGDAESRR